MAMNITEKILAQGCGKKSVAPGDFIECNVDIALSNDVTAPLAIEEFKKAGGKRVFDKDKIVLVPDHFCPNKDIKSAEQVKILREFAKEQKIKHFFEVGVMGIEHALLPEEGIVLPGDIIIGADSHTCTYGALGAFATGVGSTDVAACMITGKVWFKVPSTIKFIFNGKLNKWVTGKDLILYLIGDIGVDGANYKAIELTGETIKNLTMSDRFTMCNMAIEAGGKSGIIAPDKKTIDYVESRAERPYEIYESDKNAKYEKVIEYDCSKIEPLVAFPPLPSNTRQVKEAGNIKIDQSVIGSCTNGRIEDLRLAAKIFKGRKVHHDVRTIIFPATQKIYLQAIKEGLIEIFINSGCAVSTPTCGPCLGGHMGILAKGERAIATTNRNFIGRMGHPESEVYLSNPAVAAASAITGKISLPDDL
ncbi:MAG: 3-isopropylmalate dehydratase large subunit [Elusimicrobia bacterium RIFOXYC2_FULL_34_12]|nr:MAG: 3-isopropylmalate dehydratase large subunit [Elusimicrobia bacterium RIFOXYC2_FULL_34_12]OGS38963.1 MAG: 3-isopropylmalate dehydratase large subunit [Elusimicrobia bacterium RIFOXYD2_FULL_34_30]HAM39564.1 3-isopropylmalate dehydratase large subunit [Elusimicrobiota bacterium]